MGQSGNKEVEKLFKLHGRADTDQEQGPGITVVFSDKKI